MASDKSSSDRESGNGPNRGHDGPIWTVGTNGKDTLSGGRGDDRLYGGGGDDVINGGAGQDRVDGGAGNDRGIHDLTTDDRGWDFYFGGSGTDTLEIRLTAAQARDPEILESLRDLRAFIADTKDGGNGNDYSHMGTFSALGLKAGGWEVLEVVVDGAVVDLGTLLGGAPGGGSGNGDAGSGPGGGSGGEPAAPPEPVAVTTPDRNVNVAQVASAWAEEGVTVRELTGVATDPSSWQTAALATKNISFSIGSKNTTDSSLHGNYAYSGLGVNAKGGIDSGEIDTISGGANPTTELIGLSFAQPMRTVTIELSALFDGHDDPRQAGPDRGPYDAGRIETARVVVFGTDGRVLGEVAVSGTINGLVSVTIDSAAFGAPIGSVAIAPTSDGAGRSGDNSDFLLRSVTAQPVPADTTASAPVLTVGNAAGAEDTAIALDLSAALTDTDGSESLSVTISGVPEGATLSAGTDHGNGTWSLRPTDLPGLTLTPPVDFSGSIALTVTATSTEANGGATARSTATLTIDVSGVADAAELTVAPAAGTEDAPVALDIAAVLNDMDGSETLSVTVSGLPAGASLSAGTDNGDGSWTLAPADLDGLTLTPPADYAGTLSLTVAATTREADGDATTTTATLTVDVAAAADAPVLTVAGSSGTEDTAIPLDIAATLTDTDGSETLSVTVSGVPAGASLSAGTDNGDGSWTLAPADLDGLTITPPANFHGELALTVAATSRETNGSSATTTATVTVAVAADDIVELSTPDSNVNPAQVVSAWAAEGVGVRALVGVATDPASWQSVPFGTKSLSFTIDGSHTSDGALHGSYQYSGLAVAAPGGIDGGEIDTISGGANPTTELIALSFERPMQTVTVELSALFDGHEDPSQPGPDHGPYDAGRIESARVVVFGVNGAVLGEVTVTGTVNGLATVTLDAADFGGAVIGSIAIAPNSDGAGRSGDNSDFLLRSVTAVPAPPDDTASAPVLTVADAAGAEDTAIALDLSAALADTDGSESLSVTVSGVPEGAVLSAGTDNGDGSWTLSAHELEGLTLTPPADFSGAITLTVAATSTEMNGGATAQSTATLSIDVAGVADAASLDVRDAAGVEDTVIALDLSAALVDTDGSETLSVTISGLPAGAVLSAGTDNGDGSWTLAPADLDGLTLTPPGGFSGDLALTIDATAREANGSTATTTATLTVAVTPVADTPSLTVGDAAGDEDTAIPLDITAALGDLDGSETLSVTIAGVPEGATLSAGTDNGDGTWTLTADELDGLTFTPPENAGGTITLSITATATDSDGSQARTTAALTVAVTPVADAPELTLVDTDGGEDEAIALDITAALGDLDGSETLSVTIAGVPEGATLSAGTDNGDGSWTLAADELDGLTFTPPANASGEYSLTVTATASEAGGASSSVSGVLTVSVAAIADAPLVTVENAVGLEDTAIPLNLGAVLVDTDGSETLTITLSDVPDGAILSAGVDNGDGTWTLTPAELDGLMITPPLHFSGEITLTLTASARDESGSEAWSSQDLTVVITPTPDGPVVTVTDASGAEDTAIALDIGAALVDRDGSETLSITVSGLPDGATLSAGVDNGDGSWTLTPDQLDGLTLTPPRDFSGDLTLTVTATATEWEGSQGHTVTTLTVSVAPVADTPVLEAADASGAEDTAIALDLSAVLTDTDGSETLSITVSGLPSGAILSAGTDNGDGSWTLSAAELNGLTITPPANFAGTMALTVAATATESNGSAVTTTAPVTVVVTPVADAPLLSVTDTAGDEGAAIALDLSAALTDTDGSETLSITVSGLPDGATLSAGTDNGDGSWTLTPDQLDGLTITPPAHFSGAMALTVAATATESDGGTATTATALSVTVTPVADAPVLTVADASGAEDTAIALDLSAALTDTDGSETLSVTIAGVPEGATLSAGTDNGDGTWTLTADELEGLTFTPPENASGEFALTVTATTTESDGSTATTTAPVTVMVTPVADAPVLVVADAAGSEDAGIPLDITAALTDTDGSETLSITVSGLPDGTALSAGTNNGDGSWTLAPADLDGLTFTPPADFAGDIALSVTATSRESGGGTATRTAAMTVSVSPVADAPVLTVADAAGAEDTAIALDLSAALTDLDGSETLSVTISGVPAGAALSAGTDNGDGSWTLSAADLDGLTITPPPDFAGTIALTATATSVESDGTTATSTMTFAVAVAAVADAPFLSVSDAIGVEDAAIALDIQAVLGDQDGSETLSITVAGVPEGASLSAGTDLGNGVWVVPTGALEGLTLSPPADFSGELTLTVTATSTEGNGDSSTTTASITVSVAGVADAPVLDVSDTGGAEDTAIALDIDAALTDTDGSETLSVTISGVPEGASLSAGTDNGDGSWTLSAGDLGGLTLTPPADFAGNIALSVTATSREESGATATSTATVTVTVAAVADTPNLTVADADGDEDTAIALDIGAALADLDGSETLSVTVSGLPEGASLSAGTDNGDGSWTLAPADLDGLTVSPPANFSGALVLTVAATSREAGGGTATTTAVLTVTVTPVADAPVLAVTDASGAEDTAIALDLSAALTDTDGSETLSVTVSGLPDGATLSAGTGNGDGSWTLQAADLDGLTLTPPLDYSGPIALTVTATSLESDGSTATATASVMVTVAAVADAPGLFVSDAAGVEDEAIALDIHAVLGDMDGSETLSVTVAGVPQGATLSAGTDLGDGVWEIPVDALDGLTLTPPADFSGELTLTVTATSTEGNGDRASTTASITVSVAGAADAPVLDVADAAGAEDDAIPLTIAADLFDNDGSETLSITIAGVPAGAALSAGTDNGDGTWTLTRADLDGLTITPPADASGSFTLTVTAVSTEGGSSAVSTAALTLTVTPVADAPSLTVADASGAEDTAIALDLSAALTDLDGSETLSVTVAGLPDGAILSAGTDNGDGSWTLTAADLDGLTITPPAGHSGVLALSVTATSTESDGTQATTTAALAVTVAAVADAPALTVADASGDEDAAIALDIAAALTDLDGSETLTVTISGLPDGAVLSAGTDNGDGSWTLSAEGLAGLTLTPPANFSGDLALTVAATSREATGATATTTAALTVTVAPVADAPTLVAGNASGAEDTAIALDLSATLTDTDGSETLSVTISGLPEGAVLSAGTDNGDGSWTLSAEDLAGLTLTPPADFAGDVALTVTATSREPDGTTSTSTAGMTVTVAAVADTPTLTVADASGDEDTAIALDITAVLGDLDGSETLSVVIGGVPGGAVLSAGTDNGDGTWTLGAADLDGLTITPPADFYGDLQLTVTAVATEANGDRAETAAATLTVSVAPVADGPQLTVEPAFGDEDSAIRLDISVVAPNGSDDTLTVVVGGLPDGSVLTRTDGPDGGWYFTPPANFSGEIALTVTATTTGPGGETYTVEQPLTVTVAPVADAPTLGVVDVSGGVNTPLALDIAAALTDLDGSETLSVVIGGVPAGATLSAGTDNGDGTWTLTAEELDGLTLAPPLNLVGDIALTVTATASEAGGGTASVSASMTVTLDDGPTRIVVSNGVAADGSQDRTDFFTLPYAGADSRRTVDGTAMQIAGVAATASVSVVRDASDNPTVTADRGFGSVRNVLVEGDGGRRITTQDFVSSDVTLGDGGNSSVVATGGLSATIDTGNGDDRIEFTSATQATAGSGAAGVVRVRSGAGNDTVLVTAQTGVAVAAVIEAGSGDDVVTVNNRSADLIDGGDGNDTLAGGGGDDTLIGGAGNDILSGGAGAGDVLLGGSGNDTLRDSDGVLTADGGEGDDSLVLDFTAAIADPDVQRTVRGGAGADLMTLSSALGSLVLRIFGDGETPASDDGADNITLLGTYAIAEVYLGSGADFYQGDNSGSSTSTMLIDIVSGGAGDDEIRTGGGNDIVYGDEGNDRIFGGFGDDRLYGGIGNDDLWGNGGNDTLSGDDGNDVLRGFDGNDVLIGGDGNDTLFGEAHNDTLDGGAGDDILYGDTGNDRLDGGAGFFDRLDGGAGSDELFDADGVLEALGGTGSDSITVTFTSDGGRPDLVRTLSGGDGIDTITVVSQDADLRFQIDGDDGVDEAGDNNDTVRLTGPYTYAQVRLGGGNDTYTADAADSATLMVDNVSGGSGDDIINLGGGHDIADGGTGNDKLYGGAGRDTLAGGDGDDQLYGDAGNDTLDGGAGLFDQLYGGAAQDTLTDADGVLIADGGAGNDVMTITFTDDGGVIDPRRVIGGDGLDSITITSRDSDLSFTIHGDNDGGETAGDKADVVNVVGTYARAEVRLGGGNDTYQGDNEAAGGARVDIVYGGTGDDTIRMGGGNDVGYGEEGNDRISGGDGDDLVYGQDGDDLLWGNLGNDWVEGGVGDDTLWGNEGNDTLDGGAGNDVVYGGENADRIIGGTGNDTMTGGTGEDIFVFRRGDGFDIIQDFGAGPDKLDFTAFGFASANDVLARAVETVNGLLIQIDDDQSVQLSGLTARQLTANSLII